jgi:HD-GYP domain-containing protein (c-di-GMP phosphodiesterase class II)
MESANSFSSTEFADGLVERARGRAHQRVVGPEALVSAASATVFTAVALSFFTFGSKTRPLELSTFIVLVAVFALVSQVRFEVGSGLAMPTQLALVPMALALPARALPLAVASGLLLGWLPQLASGGLPLGRLPVVVLNSWYVVGPAAVLLAAGDPEPGWHHWPLYVAALAAQVLVDFGSGALWSFAAYGVSVSRHLQQALLPWMVDVALAPLALSIGLRVDAEPFAILLMLPLVGLLGYFAHERQRRIDHALELSRAYRGTALLLGDVIEADDAYTGSHSRAVVDLTLAVCDELAVDAMTRRDAELAALLHDVGKVRVPSSVINKPGPLDSEERKLMDTHTIEGERMLQQVGGLLGHVGGIVRSCHEHWDGSGYPDGLRGTDIPVAARIVSCCDAFHAMTTTRSYRNALSLEDAQAELRRNAGTQFDPDVVDALLRAPSAQA